MAELLAGMCVRHKAAALILRGEDEPPADQFFLQHCDWVEEIVRSFSGNSSAQQMVRNGKRFAALLRGKPMWVADWESKVYAERVDSIVRTWKPDLIQVETHVMAQYLSTLQDKVPPRVLTEYEPGILSSPYLKAGPPRIRQLAHHFDRIAWRRYEPEAIQAVQGVVVFTPQDRDALKTVSGTVPIHLIPFGTRLPERPLDSRGQSPASLLFIGSFIHPPNANAALRLARDIFPLVKTKFPDLTVYIVGDQPPEEIKRLSGQGILNTGWVPDITPYLNRAAVFVAPLDSGSGMRVKILEAMAAGKAIVATPLAVQGLDVKNGEQVLLASSDKDIADCIVQLLEDPIKRMELAASARAWACENLGWDRSISRYESIYTALIMGSGE